MVAAGTGIAPFRAFIAERARMKSVGKPVGRMLLFFGCRNQDEDYLYAEELAELGKVLGDALRIVNAFSRPVGGSSKVYVRHRVVEEADKVCMLLDEKDANSYICGSAAMAREVGQAVSRVMMDKKGWNEEEAREWSEARKRARNFQEDVWG